MFWFLAGPVETLRDHPSQALPWPRGLPRGAGLCEVGKDQSGWSPGAIHHGDTPAPEKGVPFQGEINTRFHCGLRLQEDYGTEGRKPGLWLPVACWACVPTPGGT